MKKNTLLSSLLILSSSLLLAQPSTFNAHGIGGGGAQYSPSINPANSSEIYSSTDMTDLYHSTNGGALWNVLSFTQITGGAFAMVQFTNNNNIRYCQHNDHVSQVLVPVKSTDAGATWNPITDPTGGNGSWFTIANPQNNNQVIVSDYSNLYFSNNGGTSFGAAFYTDATGNGAYVAGTFFDGSNIYVCTQSGLIISTNGGTSWSTLTDAVASEDIVGFAGAKVGATTRFFCVTQGAGNVYVGMTGQDAGSYANVYSMDYPGSWVKKVNGIILGDWIMYVGMAANNINDAYIGGASPSGGAPIVLKTGNGGASWNYVFTTSGNKNIKTGYCGQNGDLGWGWPQWVFGMNVCLTDSLTVVETDEGFIHKTTDGGKTWSALYVPPANLNALNASTPKGLYYPTNGIEMTSTWDVMWYDSVHMFGGYTDVVGVRSNDGGKSWGFDCKGLSLNTTYKFLKNPSNGVIYAGTSSVHDMYQSTRLQDNIIDAGTGALMYSTDTGKNFSTMFNFGHPVICMALDPTNATRMYASVINHKGGGNAGGIWISNNINLNAAATWTHCNNPPRTQGHPMCIKVLNDGTLIATFSGRRTPAGAFTDSSGVFTSTNQGTSWTDVSAPGMKYWTMDLTVDPNDATQNTWYCCVYSGWGGAPNGQGGLYRTKNRGTTWTKIVNSVNSNNGDTTSCFSITFDPTNKGAAYLTTETGGLFFTNNINATPIVLTQVLAYPFQEPLRVFFDPYHTNNVWVSSFGNGLEMGTLSPTAVNEVRAINGDVKVYPNPNKGVFNVEVNTNGEKGQIEVYNLLGEKVYDKILNIGVNQLNMTNESEGVYIYKVTTEGGMLIGTGKLIIQ